MAPSKPKITVAHGDGIGPEIMGATLKILEQAEADPIDQMNPRYARHFGFL